MNFWNIDFWATGIWITDFWIGFGSSEASGTGNIINVTDNEDITTVT